jgi:hypothetical protein
MTAIIIKKIEYVFFKYSGDYYHIIVAVVFIGS